MPGIKERVQYRSKENHRYVVNSNNFLQCHNMLSIHYWHRYYFLKKRNEKQKNEAMACLNCGNGSWSVRPAV
jgi:hypothetical protein